MNHRPGPPVFGLATAAGFLLGNVAVFLLINLPSRESALGLLAAGLALGWRMPRLRMVAAALFGFAWTVLTAQSALQQRLNPARAGVEIPLHVTIADLPRHEPGLRRFDAIVGKHKDNPADLIGSRLRLSWYGDDPPLAAGETWSLRVKLRRPRGLRNPVGFDFERFALEHRIAATGHVVAARENKREMAGRGLDHWREWLSNRVAAASGERDGRFVQALAVADTRGLQDRDWDMLRATGVLHLIAISGLHVGLVAGLGAWLARGLYRLFPWLGLRVPLPQAAALMALATASGYTALAGFALPTLRTLLMIATALLAVLLRRHATAVQALVLALIALSLFDPLAVLSAGFWLSFTGVAWLLLCLPRRMEKSHALRSLLTAQGVLSIALLPLTVGFFAQVSLVGPLANLLAVPWVSLVIVPLSLIGTALSALLAMAPAWANTLAFVPLWLAGQGMVVLQWLLEKMASWPWAIVTLPEPAPWALALAFIGTAWFLMPRGVPGKALALLLLLPLLRPAVSSPAAGSVELRLLDVGQGLAVLIRTAGHTLLFDTGPAYPGGFDLGETVVVPTLRAAGIGTLDRLIVSHGDNDHAGGADAVLRAYAPERFFSGEPKRVAGSQPCIAGERWQWDGVDFEWLHPPAYFPTLGNDSSCVLRIEAGGHVALLPGDISEVVESRLVKTLHERLSADLLIVPHHGSASASSPGFLAAVQPKLALIGAGYGNRFGHPRPEVLERYHAAGARIENIAATGAIVVRLDANGAQIIDRYRIDHRRFWHDE